MADYGKDVDIDLDSEADTDSDMLDAPDLQANGNGNGNGLSRPSLRETWESNPIMKIAALALGAVVLLGGYFTIFGSDEEEKGAMIVSPNTEAVSSTPGTENADPEYVRAIEERNQQEAQKAFTDGTSALPVPIGTASQSGLTVPQAPDAAQTDPLTAWRREAESRRLAMEQQVMGDEEPEEAGPAPDVVPLVQPVRPQAQAARMDPEAPARLAAQMRLVLAAQAPAVSRVTGITAVPSGYTLQQQAEALAKTQQVQMAAAGATVNADGTIATPAPVVDKVILSAGSIVYGQLMNQLNSDLPGPVLVSLLSGPFAGGRAIGTLEVRDEFMVLTFTKVIKDGVVYEVQGIALDEETTLTGHQSDVDHHYFTRIILPAAAEFIKGYAQAVAETGTSTTTTGGGGVVQEEPEPDGTEELYAGGEEAADQLSEVLEENADRPITVHLDKGTTLGILFMQSVKASNAN